MRHGILIDLKFFQNFCSLEDAAGPGNDPNLDSNGGNDGNYCSSDNYPSNEPTDPEFLAICQAVNENRDQEEQQAQLEQQEADAALLGISRGRLSRGFPRNRGFNNSRGFQMNLGPGNSNYRGRGFSQNSGTGTRPAN